MTIIFKIYAQFHKFYNAEKVLTDDIEKTKAFSLIEAARITLRNALKLIAFLPQNQCNLIYCFN